MDQSKFFIIIGPLAFRAAEKFFKFVSWAIILSVVWYAADATQSKSLRWMLNIGILIFGFVVLMQTIYLIVRDPSDWKIPPEYHTASKVVQIILGIFLMFVCFTPILVLDTIIADLKAAKLHEIVPHPQ